MEFTPTEKYGKTRKGNVLFLAYGIMLIIQRLREEAEKQAAEEAAMNAPTEKDMINDIRENRRRERRQVNIVLEFFKISIM